MNTSPFRSHLMQQFYAAAKHQSRPPLVLASATFANKVDGEHNANHRAQHHHASTTSSQLTSSSFRSRGQSHQLSPSPRSFREVSYDATLASSDGTTPQQHEVHQPSVTAQSLQQMISSRRTVSNFLQHPPDIEDKAQCQQILSDAITRGVKCASTAPNHKITEPTTFHRILSPSAASERLLDIVYEVTYRRLLRSKLSGVEACRNEAMRKRDKWSTIPAFIVATVGGMEEQYQEEKAQSPYTELPLIAPNTIRQLEDYASSCASIQNLLLSLHSEELAAKWATGPIIRTTALRELVGCKNDDMIVGLIMVGWAKRVQKKPKRRRELKHDVLRDVNI